MNQSDQEMMMMLLLLVGGAYAYKQGLLTPYIEKLKTLTSGAGAAVGGGAVGGGGGPISASGDCVGTALVDDSQGNSKRWESGNIPGNPDAYEVTWCGTFSGDDLTFKMYGPSHSNDGDCCWCVMHVKEDGKMVAGGEGPHPDGNCEHPSSSKGGSGKAPCYKATVRPGPIQEGYALVGGKWELRASYKGNCGCEDNSNKKTGNTLMVRNDGSITTKCASVKALGGSAAPAPATTTANYAEIIPVMERISLS